MAKYEGTYTCGHEGIVDVQGKYSERQYWIDREFDKLCDACFKGKRAEEINKANEKSQEKASKLGLPTLKGSDKQIAWATTIRQDFIINWDGSKEEMKVRFESFDSATKEAAYKQVEDAEVVYDNMLKVLEAKFWIDNRKECSNAPLFINRVHLKEISLTV